MPAEDRQRLQVYPAQELDLVEMQALVQSVAKSANVSANAERKRLLVWATDEQGRTSYIGPNVEAVYGYSPQEIYDGGAEVWLGRIHPADVGNVERAFADLFTQGKALDVQYRIQRKDGAWIWLHDRAIKAILNLHV